MRGSVWNWAYAVEVFLRATILVALDEANESAENTPRCTARPILMECALEVSGERIKKAEVTRSLKEFIARREHKCLLDLMGKLQWGKSFDDKAERVCEKICRP